MTDAQLVTLIAAIIAAFSGAYAVILAGSRNVAAFRVKWIEDVRLALSKYCSLLLIGSHEKNALEALDQMAEREVYLRLALNPDEHHKLIKLITRITTLRLTTPEFPLEEDVNSLLNEAQLVFKKEWKKAKREMRWLPW